MPELIDRATTCLYLGFWKFNANCILYCADQYAFPRRAWERVSAFMGESVLFCSRLHLLKKEALEETGRFKQECHFYSVEFEAYEAAKNSWHIRAKGSTQTKSENIRGQSKVLISYGRISAPTNFRRTLRH